MVTDDGSCQTDADCDAGTTCQDSGDGTLACMSGVEPGSEKLDFLLMKISIIFSDEECPVNVDDTDPISMEIKAYCNSNYRRKSYK